jgi:hypothetical protein
MCLICFNNREIKGEFEIGNTYKIKVMSETFNFSPVSLQDGFVPCWGSIIVVIGYIDMKGSYVNAMSDKIARYGKIISKDGMPTIVGESKMLIVEKFYKKFNIEEGIQDAMTYSNKIRNKK